MPGSFSDVASNSILDMLFGAKIWAPMPMLWIGLSLRRAYKNGEVLEPDASLGYGRTGLANKPELWTVVDPSTRTNKFVMSWRNPTGPWGTVLSLFIADAQRGGHVIVSADLEKPFVVIDRAPVLSRGALVIVGGGVP